MEFQPDLSYKYIANRASSILHSFLKRIDKSGYFILPSNICHDVYFIFLNAKFKIKFIDIESENLEIDLEKVLNFIKENNVIGLLYNHSYGNEYTPNAFFKYIKKAFSNIEIIDDRCLCNPLHENKLNTHADLVLYSTGYAKQVDLSFGGFAYSRKNIPMKDYYDWGKGKYKIQKELVCHNNFNYLKLRVLCEENLMKVEYFPLGENLYNNLIIKENEKLTKHKNEIRDFYHKNINTELQLPIKFQNWRFNILVKNQNFVLNKIFQKQLFASKHYSSLGTKLKSKEDFSNSNHIEDHIINLFFDKYYSLYQAEESVKIINQYGYPI